MIRCFRRRTDRENPAMRAAERSGQGAIPTRVSVGACQVRQSMLSSMARTSPSARRRSRPPDGPTKTSPCDPARRWQDRGVAAGRAGDAPARVDRAGHVVGGKLYRALQTGRRAGGGEQVICAGHLSGCRCRHAHTVPGRQVARGGQSHCFGAPVHRTRMPSRALLRRPGARSNRICVPICTTSVSPRSWPEPATGVGGGRFGRAPAGDRAVRAADAGRVEAGASRARRRFRRR